MNFGQITLNLHICKK